MPATATRSRENTAETLESPHYNGPIAPVHEDDSDFVASSHVSGVATPAEYEVETYDVETEEPGVEWREVAPLVDRFTNDVAAPERKRRRGLHKRHRNFVMSSVFWVGVLFGIELVGLVFLYSVDLRALRYEKLLDSKIQKTSLDIALAQNQLALSSSPSKLDVWAGELGYRKAKLTDMDDVTSSTPYVAPTPEADAATSTQ